MKFRMNGCYLTSPMDRAILANGLTAGFIERQIHYPTTLVRRREESSRPS